MNLLLLRLFHFSFQTNLMVYFSCFALFSLLFHLILNWFPRIIISFTACTLNFILFLLGLARKKMYFIVVFFFSFYDIFKFVHYYISYVRIMSKWIHFDSYRTLEKKLDENQNIDMVGYFVFVSVFFSFCLLNSCVMDHSHS